MATFMHIEANNNVVVKKIQQVSGYRQADAGHGCHEIWEHQFKSAKDHIEFTNNCVCKKLINDLAQL